MEKVDLSSNLYDMNTYAGRAAHFYRSVNPLNLFKDTTGAKEIVDKVKANGGVIPGMWLIYTVLLSELFKGLVAI